MSPEPPASTGSPAAGTEPVASLPKADDRRIEISNIVWLWLGMTVLLVLFSIWVPARLMGPPASPTMRDVEQTMTVFSLAASPVAALVWAVAAYSLLRWRNRSRLQPTEDGPPIRGNGFVTLTWSVVSTMLCVFLLIWGLAEMTTVTSSAQARDAITVNVTGQQWLWTFSYPDMGNVDSDQLYLPLDRPVIFHVESKDVIHSFWIVQMGIKIDANPGSITKTSVTPNKLGVFDVRCAELCGLRHADMETSVHVVSSGDFSSWIVSNGGHL